jgi:RNA polymerase sigma-70 factor (ECF subfamily)
VKREEPLDLDEARDRDLMSRIRTGDQEAFRALFHRYAPTAMALARRVLRRPTLAEETVQEAFLFVWKAPERFDPERGSLRAWLMSVVHHRAIDLVRREEAQHRRSLESVSDPQLEQDDPGVGVVEEVSLAQTRLEVRRALEDLPPAQRQVVELMYFGGYSQTQIADSMDIPLGTVKSRAMLGMRRMRGALLGVER